VKYEVHLCFLSGKGPIFEEVRKVSDRVVFIGIKNGFDVFGVIKLCKYLRREKFDIIHSHNPNILSALPFYFLNRSRKIYTQHSRPDAISPFFKIRLFYRLFSHSFQKFIAISEYVKRKMIEDLNLNPDMITVVYNGINADKYGGDVLPPVDEIFPRSEDKIVLGFVGRMDSVKRPDFFIKIALELTNRSDKFLFIMAGDGPELETCKKLIADYKMNDRFRLLGFRRDIPHLLKLFDALLFTSAGEGFGIILLEAMAAGTPVFAVNDGAIPEIIKHEENGILCDRSDPKAFAEHIMTAMNDKALIDKIKKKSVEAVYSKFSVKICARKTEEIYEKLFNSAQLNKI
jgi:glycosyltransferase involved in cell wall biosynthesis